MEDTTDIIKNFEDILKQNAEKEPLALYKDQKCVNYQSVGGKSSNSIQDVISKVSHQIKAMHKADVHITSRQDRKKLDKYKKSSFLSVNMLPKDVEVPIKNPATKFETQFVSDTQLIHIIDHAEALVDNNEITQEFDSTFSQTDIEKVANIDKNDVCEETKTVQCDNHRENNPIVQSNIGASDAPDFYLNLENMCSQPETNPVSIETIHNYNTYTQCNEDKNVIGNNKDIIEDNKQLNEDCTEKLNKCIEIDTNIPLIDTEEIEDDDIQPSLVFEAKKSKTPSPLVFDLGAFEDFEKIAVPIIEENTDLKSVKQLINSQIIGKELFIQTNIPHEVSQTSEQLSPVLKISAERLIITKSEYTNINLKNLNNKEHISERTTESDSAFLKDEILFSSDEENEYLHKEFQDIPLTCALETSFYEQPHILDKTMYVGFQTASNRSIQISRESFSKAKSLLDDIEQNLASKVTLTDLVDSLSAKHNTSNIANSTKSKNNSDTTEIRLNLEETSKADLVKKEINHLKLPDKRKFEGFVTASRKKIKLSDKALARCRKVFQDIDLDDNCIMDNDAESPNFAPEDLKVIICDSNKNKAQTSLDNKIETNPQIDDDILKEFYSDMSLLNDGNRATKLDTPITADNKDILTTTGKRFFDGIDFSDSILENTAYCKNPKTTSSSPTNKCNKVISLKTKCVSNPEFIGFKTASNNQIKITTKAFEKARNLFQDIDICEKNEIHLITAKIKNLYNAEFDTVNFNQPSTSKGFGGFKTASNKDIKVSNEALIRSKSILQDIITYVCENKSTGKEEIDDVKDLNKEQLNSDLEQVEELDDDLNEVFNSELLDIEKEYIPEPSGFKTASNKPVSISEKALAHSKNVFKDLKVDDDLRDTENNTELVPMMLEKAKTEVDYVKPLQTECQSFGNTSSNPESVLSSSENVRNIQDEFNIKTSFVGFQQANRNPINISNEVLARSKKIFKDIENKNVGMILINDSGMKEATVFKGFQTASNKEIKVSAKALAQSKVIFKNIDNEDEKILNIKDKEQDSIQQTSTSVHRNSEKALRTSAYPSAESKDNFKDINKDADAIDKQNQPSNFMGFQTAHKKPIKISAEALAKSKAIFKDIDNQEHDFVDKGFTENEKDSPPTFKGFQRPSKKAVKISAGALAKSRAIFQEFAMDVDITTKENIMKVKGNIPEFAGFQTASKKPVQISAEALAKSKALFRDIDKGLDVEEHNIENPDSGFGFKGFETASKKPVYVSAEAQAKSKALFKDFDKEDIIDKISKSYKAEENEFISFQTANRKPVKISEVALAKSKALFKDLDLEDTSENNNGTNKALAPKFIGFETASKKPVRVSAEALAKSKAQFKKFDEETKSNKKLSESNTFMGFQTANNNTVKVSEEALAKTKGIFDDVEGFKENTSYNNLNQFRSFETARNKTVKISEEALRKSRQIFQDINLKDDCKHNLEFKDKQFKTNVEFKTGNNDDVKVSESAFKESKKLLPDTHKPKDKKDTKLFNEETNNLEKLIDTQVLNNFEQTLHSEDFSKVSPRQSKRSGSPILSCPRAKRRKFNTPYRNDGKTPVTITKVAPKPDDILLLNNDYKKTKRHTLKDLAKVEESNEKLKLDPYILEFNADNLLDFNFFGHRNDLTDGTLSIEDLKEYFLKVVNKKLIPNEWLDIHLKQILWKLISYEVKFTYTLNRVCTAKNVIQQLKYRYDKELYYVERPILRKILEKDDTASKTMALCVAGIFVDGIKVSSVTNMSSNVELLLTDGWYCVKAVIDKMLTKLVYDEKITVGCKVVTNGAELLNCEQGVAPWEDTSSVRLKIYGNSTRRARWDARLGCHGNAAILTRLSSVKPEGGKVSKLRLYVTRVYPMLYVEKFEDGSTVTRSERLENIHQIKYESDRQNTMEKLYEEVEKELSDQESQDSGTSQQLKKRKLSDSVITESQTKSLEEKSNRKREKMLQDIQERVRKKIEDQGLNVGRNVIGLLKVRVAGVEENENGVVITKSFMSIWKPNDMLTEIIKEDSWIEVMNVVPTAIRYSEIHLSAGRQSIFNQCKYKETDNIKPYLKALTRKCYPVGELSKNPTMTTDYNEIDTVGFIFQIDEESSKQPFQNIYLSDGGSSIICVNFWGGLKKFGFQKVLDTGQIVSGTNLQKRAGNTRKSIPQFRVTEFTFFTKTPKSMAARNMILEIEKKMGGLDKEKYCEECIKLKNGYSNKCFTDNVSPYRFNDVNLTKNKVFIDSPLVAKREDNLNLTGLDFESTFRQTDTQDLSPKSKERKKKVNEKIARLKMIGEPPPLSPMNLLNKSKHAFNSYKSPLAQTSSASEKKATENTNNNIQSSPIIQLNRTYVKHINPVKLNFSDAQENSVNEAIDPFAEEFDASPPLSLD